MTDLDDTSRCPVGEYCLTCGSRDGLSVATYTTPVGVSCFTTCSFCQDIDAPPPLSWPKAADLSARHATHLGIDVDEMARLMDAERDDEGDDQ